MSKQVVLVKDINRVGKTSFESRYGIVELEVKKRGGGSIYYAYVDDRYTGLNRAECAETWKLLGGYLGIDIVQGEVK